MIVLRLSIALLLQCQSKVSASEKNTTHVQNQRSRFQFRNFINPLQFEPGEPDFPSLGEDQNL